MARIAYRRGASVVIVDLDEAAAIAAAGRIGDRAIGIAADVVDAEAMAAAVETTRQRLGRLDVVVANAGITPPKTTTRAIAKSDWERVVEINLLGVWRTVRAGLEEVVRNQGRVVLISSSYAHVNGVLNSSYAVTKAGVEAFGRGLDAELAPHGAGVTIAYFGYVETDLNKEVFEDPLAERFREEIAPSILTRRIPVAKAATALVAGIEDKAPRVIEPRVWRPPFYLRGLLGPISDRLLERNHKAARLISEIDARDLAAEPGMEPPVAPPAVRAGQAYDLEGKVVLITGAAKGIGFETARRVHGRGAMVALVDLDAADAEAAATGLGARAIGLAADVSEFVQIEAAVAAARQAFGRVDVVVANAGIGPPIKTVRVFPAEVWERVYRVNLLGVWNTVRAGMEDVVGNGGQFVLISSSYAFSNGVFSSPYATAKAGVEALGRALRIELAPLGASATVAYFGWIKTDLVAETFADPLADRFRKEAVAGFLTRQVPVSRAGKAILGGIENRRPRVIAPFEWKLLFYARGLIGPLMDRRFRGDKHVASIVAEAEND